MTKRIGKLNNLPMTTMRLGGHYPDVDFIPPQVDRKRARRNNAKHLRAQKTNISSTFQPTAPSTYLTNHVKCVPVADITKQALAESAMERAKTEAHLKKIPRYREASTYQFVNCKLNQDFGDSTLFKKDPQPFEYTSKSWFCCIPDRTVELEYDAMLAGVLAREAIFKPRKPALLEQLRNKANRVMADYDVSAYTSQQITDIIANTVAYVYAGTPAEHYLANVMQSKGYRASVDKLNATYLRTN